MEEKMSSEATKAGIGPEWGSTNKEEVDEFRQEVDPDLMGFDGREA